MTETKATRLKELSDIAEVPKFFVVQRGRDFRKELDVEKKYMVRSSSSEEDTKRASRAGRYPTIGPVPKSQVEQAIEGVFDDKRVDEVIVQEYVEAPEYGVAFCLSENRFFVEYSAVFEGVTSGVVKPFVAVLPTGILKYQQLQEKLYTIFHKFGPCDVEFAGIEKPSFVQVRPITKSYEIDDELETIKMRLQEMGERKWIENDLCKVVGERNEADGAFITGYFEALKNVNEKYFNKKLIIPEKPIIKVGEQYFMPESLHSELVPGKLQLLKLSFRYLKELERIKKDLVEQSSVVKLFENTILLSYLNAIFKSKSIFYLRSKYREKTDSLLEAKGMPKELDNAKKLKSELFFDPGKKTWIVVGRSDADGIVIVPGDFENGNFFLMKDPNQKIPKDVILMTSQLYPQIGNYIQDLKGIICENGSINSHISILAREHSIPLMIQARIHA